MKRRRALVLETQRLNGEPWVTVAHGGGTLSENTRGNIDLIISDPATIRYLGLTKPTRFDLDHREELPWCREYFPNPWRIRRLLEPDMNRLFECIAARGWK